MNDTKNRAVSAATIIASGLMITPALAHPGGHVSGMLAGLAHPLFGADHLLAMLAVGVWASMRPAKSALHGPVVFLTMIASGALLGMNGMALPFVEPGILASVVLLGLMVAAGQHLPANAGLAAIACFALAHGQAHGVEVAGAGAGFIVGMLAMTAGLHLSGYSLGKRLGQFDHGAWIAGSIIAAGGLALITT